MESQNYLSILEPEVEPEPFKRKSLLDCMTKAELIIVCRNKGICSIGTKQELIDRLKELENEEEN